MILTTPSLAKLKIRSIQHTKK